MAVYNSQEAYELRNRIKWSGKFYELSGLTFLPLCFRDARFLYNSMSAGIRFSELLKHWHVQMVDSGQGTSARAITSMGDAGATGDQAYSSDKINTSSEEFLAALQRLNGALTEKNIEALKKIEKMTDPQLPKRLSEDQILVGIGVHLIKQLTGKAETTLKRSQIECPCKCGGKLDHSTTMYIGSENTLHGELDMLSLGVGVTASESKPDETQETDDGVDETETEPAGNESDEKVSHATLERQSSNGRRMNLEFKKSVSADETPGQQQVIAQAITYGWTQYNRHRELSPYIPTIYIDSSKFGIFVYNPVLDSLYISETPLLFIADKLRSPVDKYSGIFILWLILHHRLFFKKNTDYDNKGFDCKFMDQVKVEFYQDLKEYSICVRRRTPGTQWGVGDIGIWESKLEESRKRKHSDSD